MAKIVREKTVQAFGLKIKVIWNKATGEKTIVVPDNVKIIKQKKEV